MHSMLEVKKSVYSYRVLPNTIDKSNKSYKLKVSLFQETVNIYYSKSYKSKVRLFEKVVNMIYPPPDHQH